MTWCQGQVLVETNFLGEMRHPRVTAWIPLTNTERTRSIQREEAPIVHSFFHELSKMLLLGRVYLFVEDETSRSDSLPLVLFS